MGLLSSSRHHHPIPLIWPVLRHSWGLPIESDPLFDLPERPKRLSETGTSPAAIFHWGSENLQELSLAWEIHSNLSTSPGGPVSVIDCDYLPDPSKTTFPPELALLIVRKAAAMAEAFEQQTPDQLTEAHSLGFRY